MTDIPDDNTPGKKRVNGILLFGALMLAIIAVTYRPTVETIYCDKTTLNPKPDVIMLGAVWCTYCAQARRYLQHNKVSYCEYDMEQSAEGKRLYKKAKGQVIPVLLIGEYQINGFNEHSIETALENLSTQ